MATYKMTVTKRVRHFHFGFGQQARHFPKRGQRYMGKYRHLCGSKGWKAGLVLPGKSSMSLQARRAIQEKRYEDRNHGRRS